MDCCDNQKKLKGGTIKMEINRNTLIWMGIGVLFVATLYLTFKAGASPDVALTTTKAAASAAQSAASSGSGMVGGC